MGDIMNRFLFFCFFTIIFIISGCSTKSIILSSSKYIQMGQEQEANQNYDQAFEYYKMAILQGHPEGNLAMGDLYASQKYENYNINKALEYYDIAFSLGIEEAKQKYIKLAKEMGDQYFSKNEKNEAKHLYQLACKKGDVQSCEKLKSYFETKNHQEEMAYSKKTTNNERFRILGDHFYSRGDFSVAKKNYEIACQNGDGISCTNLGYIYEKGLGEVSNTSLALEYYESACIKMDNGLACNNIGVIYLALSAIEENDKKNIEIQEKAIEAFEEACAMDEKLGCFNLGLLNYRMGDLESALDRMEKACDGGNGIVWACKKIPSIINKLKE